MMDIINVPMGYVLRFFNTIVGNNYFFAILVFAIIVELILLPFGIKQQKNSIKQARLRPKEAAIRKKYAGRDDQPTKQKMTQEIQELYQKEGFNPMGGCLPLLIQFPIIIALYNIVINPLKYICGFSEDTINQIASIAGISGNNTNTLGLLGKIKEMGVESFKTVEGFSEEVFSNMPDLSLGAFDLSRTPTEFLNVESLTSLTAWLVLSVPVLTFISYFFSMKVSRKLTYQPANDAQAQMGCSNKMMDIVMPLFSVFIAFGVPAALGVYWIFKSLLGVIKQVILYKAMPLPTFTEADYKAAEKEFNVRADKNTKVVKSGKVVRSLHHIDDEDFEDTADAARRRKEALEAQEAEEKKAKEDKLEANSKKNDLLSSDTTVKNEDDKPAKKKEKKKASSDKESDGDKE